MPTIDHPDAGALQDFLDELKLSDHPDASDLIGLQPGQPDRGMEYDPALPLPYPIFVGPDDRCENVPGYPLVRATTDRRKLPRLAGFQPDVETQRVTLWPDDWRTAPESAVGMVPVFIEPGGLGDGPDEGMFSLSVQITGITG